MAGEDWEVMLLSCKVPDLHPGKFTWNPKMEVWKMMFLFNWVIFRFHVNFPGCNRKNRDMFGNLSSLSTKPGTFVGTLVI